MAISQGNSHRMRLERHPRQMTREYLSRCRLDGGCFGVDIGIVIVIIDILDGSGYLTLVLQFLLPCSSLQTQCLQITQPLESLDRVYSCCLVELRGYALTDSGSTISLSPEAETRSLLR